MLGGDEPRNRAVAEGHQDPRPIPAISHGEYSITVESLKKRAKRVSCPLKSDHRLYYVLLRTKQKRSVL